jgi:hypothetical protein
MNGPRADTIRAVMAKIDAFRGDAPIRIAFLSVAINAVAVEGVWSKRHNANIQLIGLAHRNYLQGYDETAELSREEAEEIVGEHYDAFEKSRQHFSRASHQQGADEVDMTPFVPTVGQELLKSCLGELDLDGDDELTIMTMAANALPKILRDRARDGWPVFVNELTSSGLDKQLQQLAQLGLLDRVHLERYIDVHHRAYLAAAGVMQAERELVQTIIDAVTR